MWAVSSTVPDTVFRKPKLIVSPICVLRKSQPFTTIVAKPSPRSVSVLSVSPARRTRTSPAPSMPVDVVEVPLWVRWIRSMPSPIRVSNGDTFQTPPFG